MHGASCEARKYALLFERGGCRKRRFQALPTLQTGTGSWIGAGRCGQRGERPGVSGGGEPVVLAVLSGFAEVLPDRVTVLAETAERPEEIDVARAKEALARAEARLKTTDPDVDWDRATVALQRALVRIKVGELRRRVHSHSSQ